MSIISKRCSSCGAEIIPGTTHDCGSVETVEENAISGTEAATKRPLIDPPDFGHRKREKTPLKYGPTHRVYDAGDSL